MTDTDMTFRVKVAMSEAQRDLAAFGQAWRKVGVETRSAMQVAAEAGAGMREPMVSAERSANVFAGALDKLEADAGRLRASLDPAYAATQSLARAQREFADAEEMAGRAVRAGIMSQTDATKMLDLLAAKHQAAAAAATGMGAATQTAMQLAANSFAGVQAPISSAEQSAKAFAASLDLRDSIDRMRAGLDPAYAATQNVARAQLEFADAKIMADNAVEAGLISQAEAVRMLDLLAAKQRAAADAAVQMGARTDTAMTAMGATNGAVTGNVVAQLNDVWVMAAAGQNPLMTAIQQGTQLSQVFSFMGGGGGAIRTLGAAFMSLLSPTTLLTLGLVAGASALIQWGVKAIGAGDGAKTLEDRVKDLSAATRDYQADAKDALEPLDELKKKYGELADEVQRARQAQAEQRHDQVVAKLDDVISDTGFSVPDTQPIVEIQAEVERLKALLAEARDAVNSAENPTAAQFDAVTALVQNLAVAEQHLIDYSDELDSLSRSYDISTAQAERLAIATKTLDDAQTTEGKVEAAEALLQVLVQVFGSTHAADEATDGLASALAEAVESGADIATAMKLAGEEADKTAAKVAASYEAELAKQQGLASIRRVIAQYGEDSAQAANAQATAARKTYQAEQEAAGQAGVHLDNLLAAWDAANGVASVDIAGNVTLAANEAGRMAGNLVSALAAMNQLQREAITSNVRRAELARIDMNTVGKPVERAAERAVQEYRWSIPDGGYSAIAHGEVGRLVESEEAVRSAAAAAAQLEQDATAADAAWTKLTSAGGGGGAAGGGVADKDSLDGLKAQALETLTGLSTAIAAIHEKAAAGLMTTAEAAQAVMSAKEQAAGSLAELIAQLERLGPAGQAAAQTIRTQMRGIGADLKTTGADLSKELSEAFKSPLAAWMSGVEPAKDAMDDFAEHVKAKLAEIAAQEMQLKVITPVIDKLSSGLASILPFADGGVPDAPALSAHRNTVLDRPTLFPMAGGRTGLAGEAGREAIMPIADGGVLAVADGRETRLPLVRGAGGRLGVNLGAFSELIEAYARGGVPDGEAMVGSARAVRAPWRPTSLDRIVALAAPDLATRLLRAAPMGGGVGAAPRQSAPSTVVNIQPPAGHAAQVAERAVSGGGMSMDVIFEKIDDHIARGLRAGSGSTYSALTDVMGLSRAVR